MISRVTRVVRRGIIPKLRRAKIMVGFRTRVAFRGQLESRNSCEPGVTTLILARCPDPLHGWIRDDLLPRNPARIESMEEKKKGRMRKVKGRKRKNRSSPIVEITAIIARVRCFLPVAEEEHHLNHEWFINFTPGSQKSGGPRAEPDQKSPIKIQ